jgi:hypothetical protein
MEYIDFVSAAILLVVKLDERESRFCRGLADLTDFGPNR